jgi:hypothetical protein
VLEGTTSVECFRANSLSTTSVCAKCALVSPVELKVHSRMLAWANLLSAG